MYLKRFLIVIVLYIIPHKVHGCARDRPMIFFNYIGLRVADFLNPDASFPENLAPGSDIIFPEAKHLASRG